MSREVGVVVQLDSAKMIIATATGFATCDNTNEPIRYKVGHFVKFTQTFNESGFVVANNLRRVEPIGKTKVEGGDILLECRILQLVPVSGNKRVFRTDFILNVSDGELKDLSTNAFIEKTALIKYISLRKEWDIVEIQPSSAETIVLTGFAYHENLNPPSSRIHVLGYPEDFIIPKIPHKFEPSQANDTWFKFSIFTKTAIVDTSKPITTVMDGISQAGGIIKIPCIKRMERFETTNGEPIVDRHNEFKKRKMENDCFEASLWIQLNAEINSKKATFFLHPFQDPDSPLQPRTEARTTVVNPPRGHNEHRGHHEHRGHNEHRGHHEHRPHHDHRNRGQNKHDHRNFLNKTAHAKNPVPASSRPKNIYSRPGAVNENVPEFYATPHLVSLQPSHTSTPAQRPLHSSPFEDIPPTPRHYAIDSSSSGSSSTSSGRNSTYASPESYRSSSSAMPHNGFSQFNSAPRNFREQDGNAQQFKDMQLGSLVRRQMDNPMFVDLLIKNLPELFGQLDNILNRM